MHHFEAVEPRRMFVTEGLDAHFGDGGLATPPTYPDATALAVNGSVYLDASDGRHAIYKYTDAGRPDRAWGTRGRVILGFDPQFLAFDKRTGAIYAAGAAGNDFRSGRTDRTLRVARVTADGALDPSFGVGGISSYTPTRPDGTDDVRLNVAGLHVLAHRQVLVSFARRTSVSAASGGEHELALMRLNARGGRDVAFGRRGFTTVFSSAFAGAAISPSDGLQTINLGELRQRPDGGYRVVASQGRRGAADSTRVKDFRVFSQVVTPAGALDADGRTDWQLVGSETDGLTRTLRLFAVNAGDGDAGARVVARIAGGYERRGFQVFTLTPGKRPVARDFALPEDTYFETSLYPANQTRGPDGKYFFWQGNSEGVVTRLNGDFTVDRTWGRRGITRLDDFENSTSGLVGDDKGRLLTIDTFRVRRFDGIV